MWVITGVLLGLVVLATLLGFHTGPHTHLAAGAFGVLAAASLVVLAAEGHGSALLWVALAADLTLSAGIAILAWRGLAERPGPDRDSFEPSPRVMVGPGASGVAVSDLDPEGVVRVQGEDWSAVAINSPVHSGTVVQVIGGGGVRLEVWGEELPPAIHGIDASRPA